MAWSFPISLSALFQDIAVVDMTFELAENVRSGRTLGGSIVVNEYGARPWYGDVTIKKYRRASVEDVLARMRVIRNVRATFQVSPIHVDQTAIANAVTLNSVSGAYQMSISGAAAGRVFPRGTFLAWSGGGKRVLHQMTESATANGSGITGLFEVEPAIIPGSYTAGSTSIDVGSYPWLTARYVPGSFQTPRHTVGPSSNFSFAWEQVI